LSKNTLKRELKTLLFAPPPVFELNQAKL